MDMETDALTVQPPSARLTPWRRRLVPEVLVAILVMGGLLWLIDMAIVTSDSWQYFTLTVGIYMLAAAVPVLFSMQSLRRLARRTDVRGPGGERIVVFVVLPLITLVASPLASVALLRIAERGRVSDGAVTLALLLLLGLVYWAWLRPILQHWSGRELDPFEQTGDLEGRVAAVESRLNEVSSFGPSRLAWDEIDEWTTSSAAAEQNSSGGLTAWSALRTYMGALTWPVVSACFLISLGVAIAVRATTEGADYSLAIGGILVLFNIALLLTFASLEPLGNAYYLLRLKKRYLELVGLRGREPATAQDVNLILQRISDLQASLTTGTGGKPSPALLRGDAADGRTLRSARLVRVASRQLVRRKIRGSRS